MKKRYTTVEELLTDESFIRCYYQTSPEEFQRWQTWMDESPANKELVREAIQFLSLMLQPEAMSQVSERQIGNGFKRLTKKIKSAKISQYIRKK